jgi:hypothetical protein
VSFKNILDSLVKTNKRELPSVISCGHFPQGPLMLPKGVNINFEEAPKKMEKVFVREQKVRNLEELTKVMEALDSLDFMFDVEKLLNEPSYRYGLTLDGGPQRFKITVYELKEVEEEKPQEPNEQKIVGPSETK